MAHHGSCPAAMTSIRKRGRQRDLLDEHAQGNYEPEAELVELGVWRERARRNGATTTGGATGSADPVRARELQP
jgi:hypothetical protein